MKTIFEDILKNYHTQKAFPFRNNYLAKKIREELPMSISNIVENKAKYKIVGHSGLGTWATCPWIAILDLRISSKPNSGLYLVILFKANMSGFYISLNFGKSQTKGELEHFALLRKNASYYREKLTVNKNDFLVKIELESKNHRARQFEAGNIIALYYGMNCVPSDIQFTKDIDTFLGYYNELTEGLPTIEEVLKIL